MQCGLGLEKGGGFAAWRFGLRLACIQVSGRYAHGRWAEVFLQFVGLPSVDLNPKAVI